MGKLGLSEVICSAPSPTSFLRPPCWRNFTSPCSGTPGSLRDAGTGSWTQLLVTWAGLQLLLWPLVQAQGTNNTFWTRWLPADSLWMLSQTLLPVPSPTLSGSWGAHFFFLQNKLAAPVLQLLTSTHPYTQSSRTGKTALCCKKSGGVKVVTGRAWGALGC